MTIKYRVNECLSQSKSEKTKSCNPFELLPKLGTEQAFLLLGLPVDIPFSLKELEEYTLSSLFRELSWLEKYGQNLGLPRNKAVKILNDTIKKVKESSNKLNKLGFLEKLKTTVSKNHIYNQNYKFNKNVVLAILVKSNNYKKTVYLDPIIKSDNKNGSKQLKLYYKKFPELPQVCSLLAKFGKPKENDGNSDDLAFFIKSWLLQTDKKFNGLVAATGVINESCEVTKVSNNTFLDKVEVAIEFGAKYVFVPAANFANEEKLLAELKNRFPDSNIIQVKTLYEVIDVLDAICLASSESYLLESILKNNGNYDEKLDKLLKEDFHEKLNSGNLKKSLKKLTIDRTNFQLNKFFCSLPAFWKILKEVFIESKNTESNKKLLPLMDLMPTGLFDFYLPVAIYDANFQRRNTFDTQIAINKLSRSYYFNQHDFLFWKRNFKREVHEYYFELITKNNFFCKFKDFFWGYCDSATKLLYAISLADDYALPFNNILAEKINLFNNNTEDFIVQKIDKTIRDEILKQIKNESMRQDNYKLPIVECLAYALKAFWNFDKINNNENAEKMKKSSSELFFLFFNKINNKKTVSFKHKEITWKDLGIKMLNFPKLEEDEKDLINNIINKGSNFDKNVCPKSFKMALNENKNNSISYFFHLDVTEIELDILINGIEKSNNGRHSSINNNYQLNFRPILYFLELFMNDIKSIKNNPSLVNSLFGYVKKIKSKISFTEGGRIFFQLLNRWLGKILVTQNLEFSQIEKIIKNPKLKDIKIPFLAGIFDSISSFPQLFSPDEKAKLVDIFSREIETISINKTPDQIFCLLELSDILKRFKNWSPVKLSFDWSEKAEELFEEKDDPHKPGKAQKLMILKLSDLFNNIEGEKLFNRFSDEIFSDLKERKEQSWVTNICYAATIDEVLGLNKLSEFERFQIKEKSFDYPDFVAPFLKNENIDQTSFNLMTIKDSFYRQSLSAIFIVEYLLAGQLEKAWKILSTQIEDIHLQMFAFRQLKKLELLEEMKF